MTSETCSILYLACSREAEIEQRGDGDFFFCCMAMAIDGSVSVGDRESLVPADGRSDVYEMACSCLCAVLMESTCLDASAEAKQALRCSSHVIIAFALLSSTASSLCCSSLLL